ncbi:MAG: glycogen/starch synthase [bacterium]
MGKKLKILYVSAEVVPFAKTGGLADVAGALPKALAEMGHDVRIAMPLYGDIDRVRYGIRPATPSFSIPHANDTLEISIDTSTAIPGVPTYFIHNDYLYNRPGLYGHFDDDHRFIAFSRGVMEMFGHIGWFPDVINCNDWHTALIPVYLKTLYADRPDYAKIASVFSVHNIAYQGGFGRNIMNLAGLPWSEFTWDKLEYYGMFNFIKAGLEYADIISTVSKMYAIETQTDQYGEGMQGLLLYRSADYHGIVNGIDYTDWSAEKDEYLPKKFSSTDLNGKAMCKNAVQREMGLTEDANIPLFGIVSRLSHQKGLDLLEDALPALLSEGKMQLAVLGTGDEYYIDMMQLLAIEYPGKVSLAARFDNALAHRIYAGSDAFLMPSRYEPCGLGQLIAMAYGTVPVVRFTGGLADTVHEKAETGNGFVFHEYSDAAMTDCIHRAITCYTDTPKLWANIIKNCFAADFSWTASAKKYVDIYHEAMEKRRVKSEK